MHLALRLGFILLGASHLCAGIPLRRAINCPSADKSGAALTGSTSASEDGNAFAVCEYGTSSPDCTYFTDGSFSSGASTCPKGVAQDASFSGTSATPQTTQQVSSSTTSGSIDPTIDCPATDKTGSSLVSSAPTKDQAGNEFALCTYQEAGPCTYFFTDGSFSSGSSDCPKGDAQEEGATTSTAVAQTTTQVQAVPPSTTSSVVVVPPTPTTDSLPTTSTPDPSSTSTPSDTPLFTSTQTNVVTVNAPAPSATDGTSALGGLSGDAARVRPGLAMIVGLGGIWVLAGLI